MSTPSPYRGGPSEQPRPASALCILVITVFALIGIVLIAHALEKNDAQQLSTPVIIER